MQARVGALACVLAGVMCACAPPELPETATIADDSTLVPPQSDDPMLQAPAGGYVDWVNDLKSGVDQVMTQAREDRTAAQHAVQRLYESRQRYLVQYFGEGGRAVASEQMAGAVQQVSTYLQELMRQLSTDEVPLEQVEETVTAAKTSLDSVLTAGQAAGLAPSAPR